MYNCLFMQKTIAMKKILFLTALWMFFVAAAQQQKRPEKQRPTYRAVSLPVKYVPPLSSFDSLPPPKRGRAPEKKRWGLNRVVPGKGLPRDKDPLVGQRRIMRPPLSQIRTFQAAVSPYNPSDPTGAVGPSHYVAAHNIGFRIFDKNGTPLINDTDLSVLFPGYSSDGDPIVMYDQFANRYLITEFDVSNTPPKLLVAVSQTSDPVNGGWYVYAFPMNSMPDYPKYSMWSDGYYVTMNKDAFTAGQSEVVYVMERDKMLNGETAQIVGFPLPGIVTNGFYSPAGFHVDGDQMPPPGHAPIIFFQDDSWSGISTDHLKIWEVNVNWSAPDSSYISLSQTINVTPFNSVFNNGSFTNLPQPNNVYIDALQSTVMYRTNYRRFAGHNSVVLNFVVNSDNNGKAAIRWYELRQTGDGQPWSVFQEGTYLDPSGKNTFSGSIAMDRFGNIGLGYTIVDHDQVPQLQFTGRLAADPLGEMTYEPTIITPGIQSDPVYRYGDYAHMTVDPVDQKTFWHIGEFYGSTSRAVDQVGVFKIAGDFNRDLSVMALISPESGLLSNAEEITVRIMNNGLQSQTNFDVYYQIDERPPVSGHVSTALASQATMDYTFPVPADLSEQGHTYRVKVWTDLAGDEDRSNDTLITEVAHWYINDVGVAGWVSPVSSGDLTDRENITVRLHNYGGVPQSNIPVTYVINDSLTVTEVYPGPLNAQGEINYTFDRQADFSRVGTYNLTVYTSLANDQNRTNDTITATVEKWICRPVANCSYGDAIYQFTYGEINNTSDCSADGYADYTYMITRLKQDTVCDLTVQTGYSDDHLTVWIDFNDNFVFEDSERIINDTLLPLISGNRYGGTFSTHIPANAPLGEHLLRARVGWRTNVTDGCSEYSYGETEDYTVRVVDQMAVDPMEAARWIIRELPGKRFEIILESPYYARPMVLTVYSVAGQQLVYHHVKNRNGRYTYLLDMSYMPRGVYLIRMGNEETGKVTKIAVR